MSELHIGIGDYKISKRKGDVLKTFALGSCVAVMVYDKVNNMAALIHIALPDSSIDSVKAKARPAYFADTGLAKMFNEISSLGTNRKNVWIKIAGGANIMDENNTFNIGKRNILAVKKWLWKNRFGVIKEDVGGMGSRTVSLNVDDGTITISSGSEIIKIL